MTKASGEKKSQSNKKVKCRMCKVYDSKNEMVVVDSKDKKEYYHTAECYEKYQEQQKLKQRDWDEWCMLFEYLKELHSVPEISPRNTKRLWELRNGFDIKAGQKFKKYREGPTFSLMYEAYLIAEDKIKWFITDILKNDSSADAINKCITIMCNHLNDAWKERQRKRKQEEQKEKILNITVEKDMSTDPITNANNKDELDISDWL